MTEAFMEFVRGLVVESAANTYTEVEIATPASRTESMAMLIHFIELEIGRPELVDGVQVSLAVSVHDRVRTTTSSIDAKGCLMARVINTDAGVISGALTDYLLSTGADTHQRDNYDPPMLYARDKIYLGVVGTNETLVKSCRVRIGYTLERVGVTEFIAALVD